MIERLLSPHLVDALGWTLLHTLWQGALFAVLLGLILIALRTYSAQARYLVAVGFLAAFFVAAGLTFARVYQATPATVTAVSSITNVTNAPGTTLDAPMSSSAREASKSGPANVGSIGTSVRERAQIYFNRHLPLLVTIWLMGVLVLQLRFLGQLVYVQRLKSYATSQLPPAWTAQLRELESRFSIRRPVRYLTSRRVTGPFTTGWLRPVILLPQGLLEELRENQLVAILAHELAHIKRHDFAVNVLQTLLSTFFFYHPGVWWMSARIHDEREHCCDDLAVQATGERIDYARTLVQLQEQELTTPKLAMAYGAGGFGHRVRRLLVGYLGTATFNEGVVTTLIVGGLLSLAITATGKGYQPESIAPASPARMVTASPAEDTPADIQLDQDYHYDIEVNDLEQFEENESRDRQAVFTFNQLMKAVYEGKLEIVKHLLDQVDDLNQTDEHDFTPLMAAASEDELAIARLLLERGAEVNFVNVQGWTALTEAADEGSLSVARLLINVGADVNLKGDRAYRNALGMAASEGNVDVARLLLANGADVTGGSGQPPLHLAAEEGQTRLVTLLLESGADVNALDRVGRTALSYAAEEDQPSVIKLLLEAGGDPALADHQERDAMTYATHEGSDKSIAEMTNDMADEAVDRLIHQPAILLGPAAEGNLFTLKAMLEIGIDIDIADDEGNTALSLASREGHFEVVRYLLGRGARVQGSDDGKQCSPLFLAAREDHPEVIRILTANGAELENGCNFWETTMRDSSTTITNYSGATPLVAAILEGNEDAVAILLRLGTDVDQVFTKSRRSVDGYFNNNRADRYSDQELWSLASEVYETTTWTPLLEAVEAGNSDIVRLLLRAGADPNARTTGGMSAVSLAKSLDREKILALLR